MLTDHMTETHANKLPPPADLTAAPGILVAQLRDIIGEGPAVAVCVELLGGGDPQVRRAEMPYLGAQATPGLLDGTWKPYWGRVWGARGLLYVWDPMAAPAVIAGVGDEHWRVAEMCLKVSSLRELAEAADQAVVLTEHELPRVRSNAVRTLGLVGDTEHVEAVVAVLEDADPLPRKAAALAVRRITARLDLPPDSH